jgi:hypothetical protein
MAKWINRCIDFETAAIATVEENNKIWAAHQRLVDADAYDRGFEDANAGDLQWYHWAGIIGGTLTVGILGGFFIGLVAVK